MHEYKAILSGQSWNMLPNLNDPHKPVFLTYTFEPHSYWWGTWATLDNNDRDLARDALKMWGDASGITFIETRGQDAELKFQWQSGSRDLIAWAEFPNLNRSYFSAPGDMTRSWSGGDIFFNTLSKDDLAKDRNYKLYTMLHEIGHALGLKHPFHEMDHNSQLLPSSLDHIDRTVMSYTGRDSMTRQIKLGDLDIQAIQALYGTPSQDGTQVAAWSWNPSKQILTQVGKRSSDILYGTNVKDAIKGKAGKDKLYGFDGNDTISGGSGSDVLSGGKGSDRFLFDERLNSRKNIDSILDFSHTDGEADTIALSRKIFKGLNKGRLNEKFFALEAAETVYITDSSYNWYDDEDEYTVTTETRILFNEENRYVSYDPDGSGPLAAIPFVRMKNGVQPNVSDFYVV